MNLESRGIQSPAHDQLAILGTVSVLLTKQLAMGLVVYVVQVITVLRMGSVCRELFFNPGNWHRKNGLCLFLYSIGSQYNLYTTSSVCWENVHPSSPVC